MDPFEEDHFFVTLPSNVSSTDYFPENTAANYVTRLQQRFCFQGKWTVGVVGVSYTYSFFNITRPLKFTISTCRRGVGFRRFDLNTFVPKGRYESIEKLVEAINKLIERYESITVFKGVRDPKASLTLPNLQVRPLTKSVAVFEGVFEEDNTYIFIEFEKELCEILGFTEEDEAKLRRKIFHQHELNESQEKPNPKPTNHDLLNHAKRPYDLSGGIYNIFLYCDACAPSFVGDNRAQLMRTIEIPSGAKYGDQINLQYNPPYLLPLAANEFGSIEIHFKDAQNNTIPFEFGRSIVTLYFKRLY